MRIAPLETLVIPDGLDGHDGRYRITQKLLKIPAENDIEAVLLWLDKHKHPESTFRHYRSVADQLVNWTFFELGKPLSSLDESDFNKYYAFLRNPCPWERWIAPKVDRGSERWRPFSGPLSVTSLINTISIIRSLVAFLRTSGYCQIWDSIFQVTKKGSDQALAMSLRMPPTTEPFSQTSWQVLAVFLERQNTPEHLRARLALQLLFYCCLKPSALTTLTSNDFEYRDWMTLFIQEGSEKRIVYLAPPVLKTIYLLIENAMLSRDFGKRNNHQQLLFDCSLSTLKKRIYVLLRLAASKSNDPKIAEELIKSTLLSIKRGGKAYAAKHGGEMWKLIGVASARKSITSVYLTKRLPLSTQQIVNLYAAIGLHCESPWFQ